MVEVQRYLRLQVGGRSQDIGPRFADRQCVIVAVNMVKIINGLVGSTVNGKIITMYGCCGYGCGPDRNFFALRARSARGRRQECHRCRWHLAARYLWLVFARTSGDNEQQNKNQPEN